MEEWKDIAGYEGLYKISNKGNVYSCISNKFMTGSVTKSGYRQVILKGNGSIKALSIHRAVAQAFIQNPNNFPQVNHKDENKLNNCVDNLEWCTAKYNTNYGTGKQRKVEAWRKTTGNEETKVKKVKKVRREIEYEWDIENRIVIVNGRKRKTGRYGGFR